MPATVVGKKSGSPAPAIPTATLAQEEELTRVLYSRADSWLSSTAERERDRPLKSLGLLVKLSVRGVVARFSNFGEQPAGRREEVGEIRSRQRRNAGEACKRQFHGGTAGPSGKILLARQSCPRGRAAQATSARASAIEASKSGAQPAAAADASTTRWQHRLPSFLRPDCNADVSVSGLSQAVFIAHRSARAVRSRSFCAARSLASSCFVLPNSEVVTTATLVMRYRLAPQLSDQVSRLNLLINGIRRGFRSFATQRGRNYRSQESPSASHAEFLLTDNTLEFQLAGVCGGGNCGAAKRDDDRFSRLRSWICSGKRLVLANDLSLLPAPFLDPTNESPSVPLLFWFRPIRKRLRAAAIVASWFGILADSRGIRFPVTLDRIPQENAVIVGPREVPCRRRLG